MKIKFFIFLLFFVFILTDVSSSNIDVKESFLHNENFVAKINMNFNLPITESNVHFYRRHLSTSFAETKVINFGGKYYVTAKVSPEKIADNYSIVIEDSQYLIGDQIHTEDILGNFSILNGEVSFLISPNLKSTIKNYNFTLTNLDSNPKEINYDNSEGNSGIINLNSFETKDVLFVANSIGLKTVNFEFQEENYTALAYVSSLTEPVFEQDNCTPAGYDCVSSCNWTVISENSCLENKICCLINTSSSRENYTEILVPGENTTETNNTATNDTVEDKNFWDSVRDLFTKDKNETETIPEENTSEEENDSGQGFLDSLFGGSEENLIETCEELGFKICPGKEICQGETVKGKDGTCCKDECAIEEKSSIGKTIGWTILVVVVLGLTWFFKKKFKETKRSSGNLIKN